jgi:hypothetical protein
LDVDILESTVSSLCAGQGPFNSEQFNFFGTAREIGPFEPNVLALISHCRNRIETGFSKTATENLLKVLADVRFAKKVRFDVLYQLSKWQAAMDEPALALDFALQAEMVVPWYKRNLSWRLYVSWCFANAGDGRNAQKILPLLPVRSKHKPMLELARSNAIGALNENGNGQYRLKLINRVFRRAGLSEISLIDRSRPLHIDNFCAKKVAPVKCSELVSVLVPAYNCMATIHFALDSLLSQSWENIEIIVADDASTDSTAEIVASYVKRDSRVRYVRLEKNQGAYVARNTALCLAMGKFITTHDTDDWSHPKKIELQVNPLIEEPKLIGTCSFLARMDKKFFFSGKTQNKALLVHQNPSSFMYNRQQVLSLGGWDAVRVSADSELARRVVAAYGGRVKKICDKAPLSFAITQQGSLTSATLTHGRTISHGVRRSYKESASFWLESNKVQAESVERVASLRIGTGVGGRRFPVPGMILPERKPHETYDCMIVARTLPGCQVTDDLILFLQQHRSELGLIGVLTWADFWDDPSAAPHPDLRQMAQDEHIHFVSPGVAVETAQILIWDALPLIDIMDMPPRLTEQAAVKTVYIRKLEEINTPMQAQIEDTINSAFHLPAIWLNTNKFLELSRKDQVAREFWAPRKIASDLTTV